MNLWQRGLAWLTRCDTPTHRLAQNTRTGKWRVERLYLGFDDDTWEPLPGEYATQAEAAAVRRGILQTIMESNSWEPRP